jgi:hypothetical protein
MKVAVLNLCIGNLKSIADSSWLIAHRKRFIVFSHQL